MLKIELINKIENKEIANSRAIWKFLSEIEIKEINNSFGITKLKNFTIGCMRLKLENVNIVIV